MSLIRKPVISSSSSGLPSPPSSLSKETWTITCYSCGMPSSSVWAKLVRCHPDRSHESTPYYPHLLELPCPNGAVLAEDGTTHLCAFCFASLESQWSNYEKQSTTSERPVHPKDRKYNLQKFVCAVCGVKTYRKRIRALPFQEFPFLTKDRQPGSLTLGQNPLAIVCLDCSETLWAQSAEYERWGLPIQKRHFNWMARPPPPENSMEATVARLPSGETQLPRCPPIEPSVTKGRPHLYSELIGTNAQALSQAQAQSDAKTRVDLNQRVRNYKSLNVVPTSRKSSAPCLSSSAEHAHAQFPPVVTVAPMSSYKDSVSVRKGASSVPPLAPDLLKADGNYSSDPLQLRLQYPASRPVPTPSFLESPAYKALQWHGHGHGHGSTRDFTYSYNSLETSHSHSHAANSTWPWIPTMNPHSHPHGAELVNYQSYLASLASRSFGAAESYIPPPSVYPGPLPVSQPHLGLSISPYNACGSFVSPSSSSISENGHYSPHGQGAGTGAQFLSPFPSNSNSFATGATANSRNMTPGETTPAPSSRLPQTLKRNGSPTGACDIPPKNRPQSQVAKGEGQSRSPAKPSSISQIEVTNLSTSTSRARSSSSESSGGSTSSVQSARTRSYPHAHFKKRWNEAQAARASEGSDNGGGYGEVTEVAVDLSKKHQFGFASPTSSVSMSAMSPRKRSNSFSIAFLCNDSLSASPSSSSSCLSLSVSQLNPSRESVIAGLPAESEDNAIEILNAKAKVNECLEPEAPQTPEEKSKVESTSNGGNSQSPARASGGESPRSAAQALSDEEVKEFVEKAKAAYRFEERRRKQQQRKSDVEKEDFLKPLNLITTKEASELELKKTISRAEKGTLPPLEIRANSPEDQCDEMEALLQKEIRRALAENKYSDLLEGGNGNGGGNPDQSNFLDNLGLKTNSRSEKLKIEQQWCLTLLEKLLRVSRSGNGGHKCKIAGSWSAEKLSKVVSELAKACHVEYCHGAGNERLQQFTNLSVILSPEAEDLLAKQGLFNSADLLSIVNSCGSPNGNVDEIQEIRLHSAETEDEIEVASSKMAIISPVISYPRYIPSFANSDANSGVEGESRGSDSDSRNDNAKINGSILNIPNVVRHSFPEPDPDPLPITVTPDPAICVPKVPASTRRSSCSESAHCENKNPEQNQKPAAKRVQRKDSSEGKLVQVNTNTGTISKSTGHNHNHAKEAATGAPDVEGIIRRYSELMKGLRHEIDNLLSSSLTVKEPHAPHARNGERETQAQAHVDQIRKLRSALATYQSDMKVAERKLRRREKEILRSRRMAAADCVVGAMSEKTSPMPTPAPKDLHEAQRT